MYIFDHLLWDVLCFFDSCLMYDAEYLCLFHMRCIHHGFLCMCWLRSLYCHDGGILIVTMGVLVKIPLMPWCQDTHYHHVSFYVMLIGGLLWVIVPVVECLVEKLCHWCRGHISLYDRKHSPCTSSPFLALNEAGNNILTPGSEM